MSTPTEDEGQREDKLREMPTYPAENDAERGDKLRENKSWNPDAKSEDDVDPMHPDSWSGGSVVPDAKAVARGDAPANRTGTSERLPEPATYEEPTSVTRPWAPTNPEKEPSDVDATGRERSPFSEDTPRQAPSTESPQEGEPEGRPKVTKP